MAGRDVLPWVLGAALVVVGVALWLWWTAPADNPLAPVYGLM